MDGSCLFHAVLSSVEQVSGLTPNVLRRMVVEFMANHSVSILRDMYRWWVGLLSTPTSWHAYLTSMLRPETWGDIVVLYAISHMWSVAITLINGPALLEYRIRHKRPLAECDIVVVFDGHAHFSGAGK